MSEAAPPQSRNPIGRPPPQQPLQAFYLTPPAARTPSAGMATSWPPRLGGPAGRPAMVLLSQMQCHNCRGFGHYARACPSLDRCMGTNAPPAAAPGLPGADRPALRPIRMQYAMAGIFGDPWGDPLVPDETGFLSGDEPVGAAPGDPQSDPSPPVNQPSSAGPEK